MSTLQQLTHFIFPKFSARVLLVGENSEEQKAQAKLLSEYGIEVQSVSNGLEAAKRMSADRFDLVFIDLMMPNVDGFFTASLIRKVEQENGRAASKLIGIAHEVTPESRLEAIKAGMSDCMEPAKQATDYYDILDMHLTSGVNQGDSQGKWDADTVLDSHHLDGLLLVEEEGTRGVIFEVIESFVDNAVTSLSKLNETLDTEDWRQLRFDAHAFKSHCSGLGLNVLRASAACLEAAAKKKDRTQFEHHLKSLHGHLVPAVGALNTYVQLRKGKT